MIGCKTVQEAAKMTEKRTDLALEARESFPRNHVEIQGVVLEKKKCLQGKVKITTVIIRDEAGSKAMKKPKGTYITIESPLMLHGDIDEREPFLLCVCEQLESMIKGLRKKSVLVVGLGNREVTSDSLGPKMTDALFVTRHFKEEFGASFMQENGFRGFIKNRTFIKYQTIRMNPPFPGLYQELS